MQFEIVLCVVVIAIVAYTLYNRNEYLTIEASDGIVYTMLENYKNAEEAAESLATVNGKALDLLQHLRAILANGNPTPRAESLIRRLLANYDFEKIYETKPTGKSGTSFTVDKGMELHLCTREKDDNRLHSTHDLMFVMIHEMAHMANPTWGHEQDFWEVFKYLLIEAENAGIHKPVNYAIVPMVYCGLLVNYNPYFDSSCLSAGRE